MRTTRVFLSAAAFHCCVKIKLWLVYTNCPPAYIPNKRSPLTLEICVELSSSAAFIALSFTASFRFVFVFRPHRRCQWTTRAFQGEIPSSWKIKFPKNRFDAPSSQPRNCKNLNLKFSCYFCVFFTGLKIWEFSLRQLFTLSRFPFFLSCWSKFFGKTSGNSSSILLLCVCVLSFLKHFHTLTERTFHRGDFARANFHDDGGKLCDVRRVLVVAGSIRFLSHSSFYFGKYSNSRLTPTTDQRWWGEEERRN